MDEVQEIIMKKRERKLSSQLYGVVYPLLKNLAQKLLIAIVNKIECNLTQITSGTIKPENNRILKTELSYESVK